MTSWKSAFARFRAVAPARLHFAAHSHHPWPDVSFAGHEQAWLDAARLADLKWDAVFGSLIPRAQAHVARLLHLPDPETVCFGPNTHEFVMRLLSCLPAAPRILTSDSEFHSFERQMRRLEEAGRATVERVPVVPFATFAERFAAAAARGGHDLVYFSQCFYNSGFYLNDLATMVAKVPGPRTLVAVDGYHAFMAHPVNLAPVAARVFYLAGGYKYAMAGEGACFMHCPTGYGERPVDTGWFASFGSLASAHSETVAYAEHGQRFMGATFDPTPLYRFNAVQDWLLRDGISVDAIRAHVVSLQEHFWTLRREQGLLAGAMRVPPPGIACGNFLVLEHPRASQWHARLLGQDVLTDCRGDRLRLGFGLHLDASDVDELGRRLSRIVA